MSVDNITETKRFIDFVEKIKDFCLFIETHQSDSYRSFLEATQKQLVELYSYGQTLPDFDLPADRDIKEIDISDNDIRDIFHLRETDCVTRFTGLCLTPQTTTTLHQYVETW